MSRVQVDQDFKYKSMTATVTYIIISSLLDKWLVYSLPTCLSFRSCVSYIIYSGTHAKNDVIPFHFDEIYTEITTHPCPSVIYTYIAFGIHYSKYSLFTLGIWWLCHGSDRHLTVYIITFLLSIILLPAYLKMVYHQDNSTWWNHSCEWPSFETQDVTFFSISQVELQTCITSHCISKREAHEPILKKTFCSIYSLCVHFTLSHRCPP